MPNPAARAPKTPRNHHYHVYVVLLSDEVWNSARFRKSNPAYQLGKPFVYVGMTGLDPDIRFDKTQGRHPGQQFRARFRLAPAADAFRAVQPHAF